jgi:hypothetical protein
VLLCQGLLFENIDNADEVVYAFGILIVLIVCFCLSLTLFSFLDSILRPDRKRNILLYRRSARKLPWDMLLELYFLNSLIRMDLQREIEIDNNEFKAVMTKTEYEETRTVMESIYKPVDLHKIRASFSHDGELQVNMVDSILPKKPGGPLSPQILEAQRTILLDFAQSISHQ